MSQTISRDLARFTILSSHVTSEQLLHLNRVFFSVRKDQYRIFLLLSGLLLSNMASNFSDSSDGSSLSYTRSLTLKILASYLIRERAGDRG